MSYQCLDEERRIYFKKDSAKATSDIEKLIFDFDGVLVYTSLSYRQAIRRVVDYYFLEILGLARAHRAQGTYLLKKNDLEEYFDEKGTIFFEDIVESEVGGESVGIGKRARNPEGLFSQYINHEADYIMTAVNDIPYLYTNLGAKSNERS